MINFPAILKNETFERMEDAGLLEDFGKFSTTFKSSCFLPDADASAPEGKKKLCPVIVFIPQPIPMASH